MRLIVDDRAVAVHSTSEVITNSSTVTYVYPIGTAEEEVRDLLQNIMDALKVEGKAEDFFSISTRMSAKGAEKAANVLCDDYYLEDRTRNAFLSRFPHLVLNGNLWQNTAKVEEAINQLPLPEREELIAEVLEEAGDSLYIYRELVVNSRNGVAPDIAKRFLDLFDVQEVEE